MSEQSNNADKPSRNSFFSRNYSYCSYFYRLKNTPLNNK